MSTAATTTIAVADCKPVDVATNDKKADPIQLCQFLSAESRSPLACIQRTARYAEDPTAYLKTVLGEETFNQRQSQLIIPDEIDRDFYGTGKHKQQFEKRIAKLLGKQHGLFFITGVQAQLAAMKIHCDQAGNNRVAWHVSSHLESAEENAYETLYRLERNLLGEDATKNPSVHEIRRVLTQPETSRPAAILLEIPNRTLGCQTYTFEELQIISEDCRKANVKLHCDGARLWEIEPYYQATAGKTFKDIGALFDSIYVSFYKGLQGSSGAVLVTNDAGVLELANKWQRRAGGNIFTLQYQIIDAERGFNENIGSLTDKRRKMIEVASEIKRATSEHRDEDGTPYVQFLPDPPTCCQTHTLFRGFSSETIIAARDRVEEKVGIRVLEKLRPKRTVDEIQREERAKQTGATSTSAEHKVESAVVDRSHSMEWMITSDTLRIDTKVFVDGYVALCEELRSSSKTGKTED